MADRAADVVLINALENAVKFGNALFRLGDFTPALFGLFLRFLETLLFRGFLKCHRIVKEQRRYIENPLQDKQFQRFFPDKMRQTSSRVALIVGADIVILLGRKAVCVQKYSFQSPFRRVLDKSFCYPIDHRRKALISVGFWHSKCVDRSGFTSLLSFCRHSPCKLIQRL